MESIMGSRVGRGGTSDVYEWGNSEIIKIYKPHISDDVIDNEIYIGQLLNNFSLDIPRYIGSIDFEGKKALIYERINGKTMAELLFFGYYETEISYKFAQMHYDIHMKVIDELPSQYNLLKNRILKFHLVSFAMHILLVRQPTYLHHH